MSDILYANIIFGNPSAFTPYIFSIKFFDLFNNFNKNRLIKNSSIIIYYGPSIVINNLTYSGNNFTTAKYKISSLTSDKNNNYRIQLDGSDVINKNSDKIQVILNLNLNISGNSVIVNFSSCTINNITNPSNPYKLILANQFFGLVRHSSNFFAVINKNKKNTEIFNAKIKKITVPTKVTSKSIYIINGNNNTYNLSNKLLTSKQKNKKDINVRKIIALYKKNHTNKKL